MAKTTAIPRYRRHTSGQARVTLKDTITGQRKDVLLGRYGTKESRREYHRVIDQWEAADRRLPDATAPDLTINELILAYVEFAKKHYREADGQPNKKTLESINYAVRALKELFGHDPAAEFGPLKLKAVRQRMVAEGLARKTVNDRIGRIKLLFRWAVENELLPATVYHALQAVSGLQRGRTDAPEGEPVRPVDSTDVDTTLPHLPPVVQAMVRVQRYTGMRPGELVIMRPCDIDRTNAVWTYTPATHKNTWRGKPRSISLGPRARLVLAPYLDRDPQSYCFSPAEAMLEIWSERRANRKSKVQPSQENRSKRNPRRTPRDRYDSKSYAQAIEYACVKAGVAKWKPNQLRHLVAVELRERYGLEVCRAVLGHSFKAMSDHYSKAADAVLAGKAAAEVG